MVISVHPSHSQPLVDSATESFSYRWLVTMASLGMEPPPSSNVADDVDGEDGQYPGYFIDVDPKAVLRGGGRHSVSDEFEFEFLLPAPSRMSPPSADKIISGGLLLPFQHRDDYRSKDNNPVKKGADASLDDIRALSRSLSADSWSSSGTMFSSCPSRASSASLSSCSSDAPLNSKKTRRLAPRAPRPPPPITAGLSPLVPRLPKPQDVNKGPKKGGISLASIPQKIARICLCLLAAACRRAAAAVSAANNGSSNNGPSSRRETRTSSAAGSRSRNDNNKKNGKRGVSSAIQWCRAESDAAVENSIHEAVMHCKRSYSRTD